LSLAGMAQEAGWLYGDGQPNKSKVQRLLDVLKKGGLVEKDRADKWMLTGKGKKEAAHVCKGGDDTVM
ncbi:MAG: hypothetical protein ACRD3W_23575, partial [Terriglobales bacterium]